MTSRVSSSLVFKNDGLEKLKANTSGPLPFAKVGVLSETNTRSPGEDGGTDAGTNVEIGAAHEFGSQSQGVPMRSFLRMPLNQRSKQIAESALGGDMASELIEAGGLDLAAERLGIAAEAVVQEAFETRGFGTWPANSESTITSKGSDSPLIDTGQLRGAITSKVEK